MKKRFTVLSIGIFAVAVGAFAQQKLVDNSNADNIPVNGPAYMVAKSDDSRIMYRGNNTIYWYDLPDGTETTDDFNASNTEWGVYGETIFGRGNQSTNGQTDLNYAHIDDNTTSEIDVFTTGGNFPEILGIDPLGNFLGSSKMDGSSAGRDIVRVAADRSSFSHPIDNVSGGNDLIQKRKYYVQMIGFSDDKILIKSFRTSGDEEYYVWDDGDATYTQITDRANTNTDATNEEDWPLASPYSTASIAFYYEVGGNTGGIYISDGSASDATKIADVSTYHLTALAATSNRILFTDTDTGDEELYVYNGTTTSKIDLNASGSSSPREFVANGDNVAFIADDGDGYEVYVYDGTNASKVVDLATGANAITTNSNYRRPVIWAAGNGFIFAADDGGGNRFYYTDGSNVVKLDNGDTYDDYFTAQDQATAVTSEYFYHTDADKDVFRTPIPDNIYTSSAWTEGTPVTSGTLEDLYFNESYTLSSSEVLYANTVQVADGATVTVSDGTTLVVTSDIHNGGTITVESGGSLRITAEGSLFGGNISFTRRTTFDMNTGQYSVVGTPVQSATTTELGSNALVYSYDETQTSGLDRFVEVVAGSSMSPGTGYFSAYTGDANGDIIFTGQPNTGDIDVALSFTDRTDADDGYNLVANPYAAAISLSQLATDNSAVIDGNFWIWDDNNPEGTQGTNDDYIVVNSSGVIDTDSEAGSNSFDGYIRSGQGFFVKATSAGNLEFNPDQQTDGNNDAANFFRKGNEVDFTRFKLALTGEGVYHETLLAFRDGATSAVDFAMDAPSLSEREHKIFTYIEDRKFAIQTLSTTQILEQRVSLGLDISSPGTYEIDLRDLDNMPSTLSVLLLDGNQVVNLAQQAYSFEAQAKSSLVFDLAFENDLLLGITEVESDLVAFQSNGALHVRLSDAPALADIVVHDFSGKVVATFKDQHFVDGHWTAPLPLIQSQLYILSLTIEGERKSVKFIY